MANPKWAKEIGSVSVDSGQIVILDPCYLDKLSDDYYENVCSATELGGGNATMFDHMGMAVASGTAYGDGLFPVFAVYEAKDFKGLYIHFGGALPEFLNVGVVWIGEDA